MVETEVLPSILIIDDDTSLLESYTVLLEDEFQVCTAETGETGLDVLQHQDIHLVLLDVRLPGIDGIEVLRRIKALDENVDVIMITAVKNVRVAVEAKQRRRVVGTHWLSAFRRLPQRQDVGEIA